MTTIKMHFSNKRSMHHYIYSEPSTNKSQAAYILLRNSLYEVSDDHWSKELKKWINFRNIFLTNQVVDNKLICVYCGRDDLVAGYHEFDKINLNNKIKNLATIDHIKPLSRNGEKYDKNNCCCSCRRCNTKKGNKELV